MTPMGICGDTEDQRKRFYVYEIQEETTWRKWRYTVEAKSEKEAVEMVANGFDAPDPKDCGEYGGVDYGERIGWSVGDGSDEGQRWADAADTSLQEEPDRFASEDRTR